MQDDTNNKNMFLQNQYLAMKICDIFNVSVRSKLTEKKNLIKSAEFPTTNTIYQKDIVMESDPKCRKVQIYSNPEENFISNKENIEKNEVVNTNSNTDNEKKEPKRIYKEDLKNLLNNKNKINEKVITSNSISNLIQNSYKTSETISTSNSLCSNDNSTNGDKSEKILESISSDYSNSFENTEFSNKKRNSIFVKKEKSRFNFANENTDENKDDNSAISHDFVCDYISFKTSTFYYFKNVELDEYINSKYKINTEEWQKIIDLNREEKVKN